MIGRLLRKSDFERLLAVPPRSRSAHFALHHVQARPGVPAALDEAKLCTDDSPIGERSVDNQVSGWWIGTVLPKRHAPRSVTRNMLRRQIRAAMQRHRLQLPTGMWLVRLRQPLPRSRFISADSATLRGTAASELDRLLQRAKA
jgi:ribonuclease P protein component